MGKTNTVENIIRGAIREVAGSTTSAVAPAAAVKEAAAVVINQTNNEPWIQSRVTLGALGGTFGAVAVILNMFATGDVDVVQLSGALATLIGAGVTLWGRWAAKKPLGA